MTERKKTTVGSVLMTIYMALYPYITIVLLPKIITTMEPPYYFVVIGALVLATALAFAIASAHEGVSSLQASIVKLLHIPAYVLIAFVVMAAWLVGSVTGPASVVVVLIVVVVAFLADMIFIIISGIYMAGVREASIPLKICGFIFVADVIAAIVLLAKRRDALKNSHLQQELQTGDDKDSVGKSF
ncbi:MAG: hypothetical protein IJV62_03165 [Eggerthellaceae bacterium]|nr:hypothetical protein [Eggerthellaceae bacterium]